MKTVGGRPPAKLLPFLKEQTCLPRQKSWAGFLFLPVPEGKTDLLQAFTEHMAGARLPEDVAVTHYIRLSQPHARRRPLRALAFDLDSTLTRPYLDFTRLRAQLGLPEGDILHWADALPPRQRAEAFATIEAFEQDGVDHVAWNDGAQETVAALQAGGLPVAIITRNSRASLAAVCARLDIRVDVLIAREDATPKPDPACVRLASARLGVRVETLLMVGDFRHDTEAGRAAGAMTVLLTNGKTPPWTVQADLVIQRLPELLAYVEKEETCQ